MAAERPYYRETRGGTFRFGRYYNSSTSDPWPEGGYNRSDTWKNYLSGFENPSWEQDVKLHENATTPYTAVMRRRTASHGYAAYYYSPKKRTYFSSGDLLDGPNTTHFASLTPSLLEEARLAAEAKFAARYDSTVSGFQAGVFSGEIRETMQMLRHPLQSFRRGFQDWADDVRRQARRQSGLKELSYKTWKRLDGKTKKSILGGITGSWYEFTFGLKPVMADLKAIMETLDRPQYTYSVISTSAKRKLGYTGTSGIVLWGGSARTYTQRVIREESSFRCVGEVRSANSAGGRMRADFGIMPSQFLPTVWELIPYSWLVDYFTNMGDIVAAACRNYGDLSWYSGTANSHIRNSRTAKFLDVNSNMTLQGSLPCFDEWLLKEVSRSGTKPSTPPFQFDVPNTVAKWLNVGFLAPIRRL